MIKVGKGLREQLEDNWKEKYNQGEEIIVDNLKDYLMGIFKDKTSKLNYNPLDYPQHHVWEEDGQTYSMWVLAPGFATGDGGIKLYSKALKEEAKKYVTNG